MGIGIEPFPPLLIPESALLTVLLQLPFPLLTTSPFSLYSQLYPMSPLLSLSLSSSSWRRLTPPPYLPLHFPRSYLQCNFDPVHDLDLDLYLIVDAPKAVLPLDLFIPLLRGNLDIHLDLVLELQEDSPLPLLPLSSPPSLLRSLHLQQPHPPPPIHLIDLSVVIICRFYTYLSVGSNPFVFPQPLNIGGDESFLLSSTPLYP